jgi:hypothetical protein
MRLALATICLNEMQWLPKSLEQHSQWPGLVGWVIVEGADVTYAELNPHLVRDGLSVDGTTELLEEQPDVTYIKHGLFSHPDPAQAKCVIRNRYMEEMERLRPTHVLVLDADEFYSRSDQERVTRCMSRSRHLAFTFRQRHIYRPFTQELVGGYWAVPHTRGWAWSSGAQYVRNHNFLEDDRGFLTKRLLRADRLADSPQCVHMGYAGDVPLRAAKHRYYEVRGESSSRPMYVACRRGWERGELPRGVRIASYKGPVPECFACCLA